MRQRILLWRNVENLESPHSHCYANETIRDLVTRCVTVCMYVCVYVRLCEKSLDHEMIRPIIVTEIFCEKLGRPKLTDCMKIFFLSNYRMSRAFTRTISYIRSSIVVLYKKYLFQELR